MLNSKALFAFAKNSIKDTYGKYIQKFSVEAFSI